jgi:phosphate uptake regulator
MNIQELNRQVDLLAVQRKLRDNLKGQYELHKKEFEKTVAELTAEIDKLGTEIDETQGGILQVMSESGTKSWKTDSATISKKEKVSYKVQDKDQVIKWLKENNLDSEYTSVELKPEIKGVYEQKEVPGVSKESTEYISVLVK